MILGLTENRIFFFKSSLHKPKSANLPYVLENFHFFVYIPIQFLRRRWTLCKLHYCRDSISLLNIFRDRKKTDNMNSGAEYSPLMNG